MRPFIDITHVATVQAFIDLDRTFGLAGRLNLYNQAATDKDALSYIDAMENVLSRDEYAQELIRSRGLSDAAGTALAALTHARLTILGHPPGAPFNNRSTPDRLVL